MEAVLISKPPPALIIDPWFDDRFPYYDTKPVMSRTDEAIVNGAA
jgi:hypothetical protein